MLRYLGGLFGIAILVAVFSHTGNLHSAEAFSRGFSIAVGASAGLSITGAIAGLWLPRAAAARIKHCRDYEPKDGECSRVGHLSAGAGIDRKPAMGWRPPLDPVTNSFRTSQRTGTSIR